MHLHPPGNLPVQPDSKLEVSSSETSLERAQAANSDFTEEGVKNLLRLAGCVRKIVARLAAAGWQLKNNNLISPAGIRF